MKGSKFTDIERHAIRQAIVEAGYSNLNDKETLALVKVRTSIDIGHSTLGYFRREIKSGEVELWLDEYAQTGYIEDFKDSLDELKALRNSLWNTYNNEISKPVEEQKYYKLVKLAEMLTKINMEIRYSTFQTPAMRLMKYYIDKGKQSDRQPLQYHELGSSSEDGSESSGFESGGGRPSEDENRVA